MAGGDVLERLGVSAVPGEVPELRVWSANAKTLELVLFDDADPHWMTSVSPLTRGEGDVWSVRSPALTPGRRYTVRASGPSEAKDTFNSASLLLDPYARGVVRLGPGNWRSAVVDDSFDWGGVDKPAVPLDRSVIYEAHVRGFSKTNKRVPAALRGSYAGLGHEGSIDYLKDLGVTAVELLPVHAFGSEMRLVGQGLSNYWGYNSFAFFAPHPGYASRAAQQAGPSGVLREFKQMVKSLHEAGIEVILDVVYNHTAEEGIGGPRYSFRGIDNASYYRQTDSGQYIDTTGCGNSLDFGHAVPQRLVIDSIRYWANELQVDGFRFDLAAALGRDERVHFDPQHPLLTALRDDPALQGVKLIAEPWDVGMGGWQTGNFPDGWSEWNDGYRGTVRDFWLSDIAAMRHWQHPPAGIGRLSGAISGSADVFHTDRGPLASVNFVTAHDGFTLADLTAYNTKHNLGNGEQNRDGTSDNRSFNFGVEGDTRDPRVLADRRRAMRNMTGTLLLSAGIPMITAGDEYGRTQRGNNNAYCHDSDLTWVSWLRSDWQEELREVTRTLLRIRRENPALRPKRYAVLDQSIPHATERSWFSAEGHPMADHDWHSPSNRTVQFVASSTPDDEPANTVLVVVHGAEHEHSVVLPGHEGISGYELLWTSADDAASGTRLEVGERYSLDGPALAVFRAS
ncbi:glycogen debranching protein GlgX [Herbiconiux sp. L3-i23]|uniref:glycogen debranching protein GlgX n=1 Tax=Herbiconiux sp. L3-i23 TaxID=2905871 RepID=UPI0020556C8D|nr:glycogen debranching protein GlgX [Herbiconiux sp. L3-i23]BDI21939.1 glycogen operon protein GlgX homolog [Herbiconiux sp. L3-i23]